MTTQQFIVEPLDAAKHRRDAFVCESDALTRYLRERARKEVAAKAAACFVIVPQDEPTRVAGFYTLAAASVALSHLPPAMAKRQPKYSELPVTLLGRLARDTSFKGGGIGERLMMSVFVRTCASSSEVGSIALVADPKDEHASRFYMKFGFEPLDAKRLILPMGEVCRWVGSTTQ